MLRQLFPVSSGPSLPAHLPRCRSDGVVVTDDKSCRGDLRRFWLRPAEIGLYGNSSPLDAAGSPGKVRVKERERLLSGDLLLSEPPGREQKKKRTSVIICKTAGLSANNVMLNVRGRSLFVYTSMQRGKENTNRPMKNSMERL